MSRRARWSVLGRTVWGLAVLALAAGAVVAAAQLPVPDPEPVPPVAVDVPPASTVLVCPGGVRLPTEPEAGDDVAYDPQFDPAPGESEGLVRMLAVAPSPGTAPGELLVAAMDGSELDRLGPQAPVGSADSDGPALVLRADATDDAPAWLAGAIAVRTDEGDLRGLAAGTCQVPAVQSWLVGGDTELGSSARLVLQNPGATPASVTVRLWGPTGPVELAGAPEYLVPPGSERVVLLEGVAAEQRRVVVQVAASGGLVTAYLQDSWLRGLVPAGVDHVVAGTAPSTRQVVPISVTDSDVADVDVAQVRLLAPGEDGGTVRVSLFGPEGPVELPGATEVVLDAGVVLDVPLGGLPAGSYLAVLDSEVPVVAGAMSVRAATDEDAPDGLVDRAWAASVPIGAAGPLALPRAAGRLLLTAVPDEESRPPGEVTVEVVSAEGTVLTELELVVFSGLATVVDLTELGAGTESADVAGLVVRSDDPRLAWAVVLTEDDLISVLTPVAPPPAQPAVEVYVR